MLQPASSRTCLDSLGTFRNLWIRKHLSNKHISVVLPVVLSSYFPLRNKVNLCGVGRGNSWSLRSGHFSRPFLEAFGAWLVAPWGKQNCREQERPGNASLWPQHLAWPIRSWVTLVLFNLGQFELGSPHLHIVNIIPASYPSLKCTQLCKNVKLRLSVQNDLCKHFKINLAVKINSPLSYFLWSSW